MTLTHVSTVTAEALELFSFNDRIDITKPPEAEETRTAIAVADSQADAATNSTAIAQAIVDAKVLKKAIVWPGGKLYIASEIDLRDATRVAFLSKSISEIVQVTNNAGIFHFGCSVGNSTESQIVGDWICSWLTKQTTAHTNSIGMNFTGGNVWLSRFGLLEFRNGAVGWKQSSNFMFSNSFEDIAIRDMVISSVDLRSTAQSTGNKIGRLHISNGSTVSTGVLTGYVLRMDNYQGTDITQLNLEWSKGPSMVQLNTVRPINITSLHIEGLAPTGDVNGFFQLQFNSVLNVEAWDIGSCTLSTTNALNTGAIVVVGDSSMATFDTGQMAGNTLSGTSFGAAINWATGSVTKCTIRFRQVFLATGHGLTFVDGVTLNQTTGSVRHAVVEWNSTRNVNSDIYQVGDADCTFAPESHGDTLQWSVPLTADRTITLGKYVTVGSGYTATNSLVSPFGIEVTIGRTTASNDGFAGHVVNADATSLPDLVAGEWRTYKFNGTVYVLTKKGTGI